MGIPSHQGPLHLSSSQPTPTSARTSLLPTSALSCLRMSPSPYLSLSSTHRSTPYSTNAQYDPTNLPAGIHLWTIDQAQSDRISKMLDFDFASLGIKGTYLENPQLKCQSCGKLSGLDDFVSGALKLGMHNTDFMIRALIEGAPNTAPAHKLKCCVCDTFYRECDFVRPPATDKHSGSVCSSSSCSRSMPKVRVGTTW